MYKVQDESVRYNNAGRPVICEGLHDSLISLRGGV
jgi:hypothetical protein